VWVGGACSTYCATAPVYAARVVFNTLEKGGRAAEVASSIRNAQCGRELTK
jgi:hypothetical protein